MAITMDITTIHGLLVEDAYIKIISVKGGKGSGFFISVNFYVDKASADASKVPLQKKTQYLMAYDANAEVNVIKQAYVYLKTLDEFAEAEDA